MISLTSSLTNQQYAMQQLVPALTQYHFQLGGNWDYEQGCFDQPLDSTLKVWLRLPFNVVIGQLDEDYEQADCQILMGQPYLLKHLYQEGNDNTVQANLAGALVNQFQTPTDVDAQIEPSWLEIGEQKLRQLEKAIQSF